MTTGVTYGQALIQSVRFTLDLCSLRRDVGRKGDMFPDKTLQENLYTTQRSGVCSVAHSDETFTHKFCVI